MRVIDKTALDAVAMTADRTSETFLIDNLYGYCVQSVWTGTPVGDIIIQESNDGVTWSAVDTQAAGGAAGSDLVNMDARYAKYMRVFFDFGSSTGTLTTKVFAKGP